MGYDSKEVSNLQRSDWRREKPCIGWIKPQLVAFALGLTLIFAGNAAARTGEGTEPCVTGHRFEPGPIVNGHHRQPTLDEIEARTQQLRAWNSAGPGSCLAAPFGSEASTIRPPNRGSPDRVVELHSPSSSGNAMNIGRPDRLAPPPAEHSLLAGQPLPKSRGA
jgi:hypothetical protein